MNKYSEGEILRRTLLLISGSVIVGLLAGLGVFAVVAPSQATSTGRSICVDNQTRELKLRKSCKQSETFFAAASVLKQGGKSAYETWLELGNKGTKQDFLNSLVGPRGSNGVSNSSVSADGLGNCYQKRQMALSAGVLLVMKKDRDLFERETGCTVEEIKDETFIEYQKQLGLPVITQWQRTSMSSEETFANEDGQTQEHVRVDYFIWVDNWEGSLDVFAVQDQVESELKGLCSGNSPLEQIEDDKFRVTLSGWASGTGFFVDMNLGVYVPEPSLGQYGVKCRPTYTHPSISLGYLNPNFNDTRSQRAIPFVVWEDPAVMPEEYGAGVFKELWGW